jgi:hypothetical protein
LDRPEILEIASAPLLKVTSTRELPAVAGIGWDHPDARPKAVDQAVAETVVVSAEPELPMAGVMAMADWRSLVGWVAEGRKPKGLRPASGGSVGRTPTEEAPRTTAPIGNPPEEVSSAAAPIGQPTEEAPRTTAPIGNPPEEVSSAAAPIGTPSSNLQSTNVESLIADAAAATAEPDPKAAHDRGTVVTDPTAERTVRTDEAGARPGQVPAELAEARPIFHRDRLPDSGIVLDGMQGYALQRMIGRFTVTQLDGMRLGVRTRELVELLGVLSEAGVVTYAED